jgi:ergothioneine biosynthesis protein EgtB
MTVSNTPQATRAGAMRRDVPVRLSDRFSAIRGQTQALCQPLKTEDYVVSSMPDVSPAKWHLAHTTWFFEQFVLGRFAPSYRPLDPRYAYLFNSYYVMAGERHCRSQRGLATRPTVAEVYQYREHVNEHMRTLVERLGDDDDHPATKLTELGLQHEQQHQELLLMDIKHVFWMNPLRPVYRERVAEARVPAAPFTWFGVPEGLYRIGHRGRGFAFDNEAPVHRVFLETYRVASRLVTNGEYLAFMEAGAYRRPELWLANGWATVRDQGWESPLYWERNGDDLTEFTLAGTLPLDLNEPVTHVSYYEAEAFARWAGARLPTEAEWEVAAGTAPITGTFAESGRFHPAPAVRVEQAVPRQLYGDAWQWTGSAYLPYPGFQRPDGAIGEYNGKWMSDQWVLRGASCVTPRTHARLTYRNFFPSDARWPFTGIRLAV